MIENKKQRKKSPVVNGEELTKHALSSFRRLLKLPGPNDRLQTREFRTSCDIIQLLDTVIETPFALKKPSSAQEHIELISERYSRSTIANYLLYHWPLHLFEGISLINELPNSPKKVLDIGAGAGSYGMSALFHGASEVTLFDQSDFFLEAAGDIIGRWGYPIKVIKGLWPKKPLPEGLFDLITIGHAIQELSFGSHDLALKLIKEASQSLDENGFLLITTSSKDQANRWFLELRDKVIEEGYEIQAPCVWQGLCPAKQHASSPCYAQRKWEKPHFIKEIQRGASIFLNSLKMSYLILRSPKMAKRSLAVEPLYRVISPPIDMLGEKRYFLCGTQGKKHIGCRRGSIDPKEPLPKSLRAFQFLERGSLISFEQIVEKNEAIDLMADSSLSLVAPCDKPIPEKPSLDDQTTSE
ncbi:MAG: small ribosomal subunit Rsm22 family protein [Chlamydia sp.]